MIKKPELIETIRNEGIETKQKGRNYWAICPFHNEKTPSMKVDPQKQIWYCHGCGKGGDVFTFVREMHGLTFPQALRYLNVNSRDDEEIKRRQREREQKEMLKKQQAERHDELCKLYRCLQKAKTKVTTIEDLEQISEFYHKETDWLMLIEELENES